jgi:hypothetical protein
VVNVEVTHRTQGSAALGLIEEASDAGRIVTISETHSPKHGEPSTEIAVRLKGRFT